MCTYTHIHRHVCNTHAHIYKYKYHFKIHPECTSSEYFALITFFVNFLAIKHKLYDITFQSHNIIIIPNNNS